MKGFDRFSRQIEEAKKRIEDEFKKFKISVAYTLFQHIAVDSAFSGYSFGSPVLTGRYLSSHTISDGVIDNSAPPAGQESYTPKDASYAKGKLAGINPYGITYIASNVPYAKKLEDGFSLKAPGGIYSVAVALTKVEFKVSSNPGKKL